jgi:hypothetical protein
MFVTIDTNTDSNTGNITGGATHIDVMNYGDIEATITIAGKILPIPSNMGWSSSYRSSGFSSIAYSASVGSRLVIVAWD